MANLNHVGKVVTNGRRCLVAYRTLPGDAYNCLIIPTESLQDSYHDSLMSLVETNAAQSAFEFAEVLHRSTFPDGSNMLISLHAKGHLIKIPTDNIEMVPNPTASIRLSELNHLIAQQRGVSVQDLAIRADAVNAGITEVAQVRDITPKTQSTDPIMDQVTKPSLTEALTDGQLALKYRNDAKRLAEEANSLLKMAEELSPTEVAKIETPVGVKTTVEVTDPIVMDDNAKPIVPEVSTTIEFPDVVKTSASRKRTTKV